jgi:hypothetical protein
VYRVKKLEKLPRRHRRAVEPVIIMTIITVKELVVEYFKLHRIVP